MSDVYPDPPDEISVLALRCLTHIKNRTGMDLDGRSETLSVVDFFIRDLLTEEGGGELPPVGDHRRADAMHLLAPAIGAYFGEVVRTVFPCRWRMDTSDPREWTIDFDNVPLRFSPIGAAAEALLEHHAEGWGASLSTATEETESLGQRLKAAPPVPEDEFFALTTRFEVLQIAVEWLRTHMALRDIPPPEFYTEEDYDYIFGNR